MQLWGLPEEEEGGILLPSLLLVLRLPGLVLLDLWWMDDVTSDLDGVQCLVLVISLALLLLPLVDLVKVYTHLLAGAAMGLAYLIATQYVEDEAKLSEDLVVRHADFFRRHLCPVASYVALTTFVTWSCGLEDKILSRIYPSIYIAPVLFRMVGLSVGFLQWSTNVVSGFLVLSSFLYSVGFGTHVIRYVNTVREVYTAVWQELGLLNITVLLVRRLLEPAVLMLYWCFLFLAQCWNNFLELEDKSFVIQDSNWFIQILVAMSEICESPLVLISFCIVIMMVSWSTLTLTRQLLALSGGQVGLGHPVVQSGATEGVVAFVLALQTGLVELDMPSRIGALSIILFVVSASLLQSCLEVTMPTLLSMPATNKPWTRHLVPLTLVLLLLSAPLAMVVAMLTKVSSALWTLVIVSSCLVTAVQALGCLATYSLFVWDSRLPAPSPNTDDYVYYVKGATRTGEVLLAVVLVSEGFYESLVQDRDWSLLNNLVLLVHCYFNIYSRLSQGWAAYLARRQTSMRLSELHSASREELAEHQDVCSICYQEMSEGGVVRTLCRHFFHTHCLRRWLVVQDNCPLCTQPIVATDSTEDETDLAESDVEEDVGVEDVVDVPGRKEGEQVIPEHVDARQEVGGDGGLRQRQTSTVNNLFDGD